MNTQPNWLQAVENWLLWTMFAGIGWPIALILSKGFHFVGLLPVSENLENFVSLVIGGIVIALFQLIYLAPDVQGNGFWVMATMMGWVSGALVTWLLGQAGDSFYRFGWLIAGLIGGVLYGGFQSIGLNPSVIQPLSWITRSAMSSIAAYAVGVILLSRESTFHLSEFLFISWGIIGLIMFTFNLLIIPQPRRIGPPDGEAW